MKQLTFFSILGRAGLLKSGSLSTISSGREMFLPWKSMFGVRTGNLILSSRNPSITSDSRRVSFSCSKSSLNPSSDCYGTFFVNPTIFSKNTPQHGLLSKLNLHCTCSFGIIVFISAVRPSMLVKVKAKYAFLTKPPFPPGKFLLMGSCEVQSSILKKSRWCCATCH